jgi:hypothetical protein
VRNTDGGVAGVEQLSGDQLVRRCTSDSPAMGHMIVMICRSTRQAPRLQIELVDTDPLPSAASTSPGGDCQGMLGLSIDV